jgi:hypothetical protein
MAREVASPHSVNISGQIVYLASGFNNVNAVVNATAEVSGQTIRAQIFDPSGNQWLDVWSDASGSHKLLTAAVVNANANISGQTVYLASGNNDVQVSGQSITVSNFPTTFPTSVSGNIIRGQLFDPSGNQWLDLWNDASGSHKLAVTAIITTNVSGNVVYFVSGKNDVQISGQTISIAGTIPVSTSISGNVVSTSISGNNVLTSISGNNVIAAISGQTIRPQLFDPSGAQWLDLWNVASGQHALWVSTSISGNNVVVPSTSVSGNVIVTSVSGNAVNVSGNTVLTSVSGNTILTSVSGNLVLTSVSGNNIVTSVSGNQIRGQLFDPSGAAWRDLWSDASGSNRLLVSVGNTPNVSVTNTPTVTIGSQPVSVSTSVSGNTVGTSVSGNVVNVSGNVVNISGNAVSTSVSGNAVTTSVSGNNVIAAISGQTTRPQLFDPSGNQYLDLWNDASGSHKLLVSAAVTTNISGQTVYLASGNNAVQNSGQAVLISGQLVAVSGIVGANVSGNTVYLISGNNAVQNSGQALYNYVYDFSGAAWREWKSNISGSNIPLVALADPVSLTAVINSTVTSADAVNAAGVRAIYGASLGYSYDAVTSTWQRLRTTASGQGISGATTRLIVAFSGDPATISGNVVNISGNVVSTNISGNTVYLPNDGTNNIVAPVSGNLIAIGNLARDGSAYSGRNVVAIGNTAANTFCDLRSNLAAVQFISNIGTIATSFMHGYDPTATISGAFVKLFTTVSGAAGSISGYSVYKLLVSASGDPMSVSGNVVNVSGNVVNVSGNAVNVSGNAVNVSGNVVNISGNVVNVSGMAMPISGQTVYLVSGQNSVSTFTPATYTAYADNLIPASGGVLFAMEYRSGASTITLKKMFLTNIEPSLTSGQYIRFDICRTSGLFSGGTAISAVAHDPTDANSGASLNIASAVTSSLFPSAARSIMFNWANFTRGWASGGVNASEAATAYMIGQGTNMLPESVEMKEVRLTSGYGVILQQTLSQTGYTQVTSGRFSLAVVYTII